MLNETSSTTASTAPPCISNSTSTAASADGGPSFVTSGENFMYGAFLVLGLVFAGYLVKVLMDFIGLHLLRRSLRMQQAPTRSSSGGTYEGLVRLAKKQRRQLLAHMLLPTIYIESSDEMPPVGQPEDKRLSNDAAAAGAGTVESPLSVDMIATCDIEEAVVANVDAEAAVTSSEEGASAHDVSNTQISEEDDYKHSCSICLSPYQPGTELLRSKHCVHMFHYDCCMEWLEKKSFCPYCRAAMFTAEELRAAAEEVLGPGHPMARKIPLRVRFS